MRSPAPESAHPPFLAFWAKTDRREGGLWHPAAYHMLDVAAVAEGWLASQPDWLGRLAGRLATDPHILARAVVALVGLHDLGKFSRAFQAIAPYLWPQVVLGPAPAPEQAPRGRHDQLLLDLLTARMGRGGGLDPAGWPLFSAYAAPIGHEGRGGGNGDLVLRVLAPIAGHHGQPVDRGEGFDLDRTVGAAAEAAAAEFVAAWFSIVEPAPLPLWTTKQADDFAWSVAGLTVVADWLGSGPGFGPSLPTGAAPARPLADYWTSVAQPKARDALRRSGLFSTPVGASSTLDALFAIGDARPLQRMAETVPLPDGPTMIVVEDVTGAGKTEAAVLLAHRLMRRGDASGLYLALPTMATANAMFGRLQEVLARLFAAGDPPSLVLAHGKRDLHPAFRVLADESVEGGEEDVARACAEWIADDRRKAFLAQVGAGTIDQALLAVLPARYQSLRLFGLSDRVLVIDEAHAYDAYTGRLLETLVRFHAGLGGSIIVLSATLHAAGRRKLADAFRRGLRAPAEVAPEPVPAPYPLISVVGRDSVVRHTVEPVAALARTVAVTRLATPADAERRLIEAHRAGGALAYIRNSVQDAIDTTDRLRAAGLDPILFHARFAMGDRQAIEADVIARFGRDADPRRRCTRPLVATQVVEQSLDLDFDLLVSDLAPIDLLLQRAGRVWRHMDLRPPGGRPVPAPRLLVVSPDPAGAVSADWVKAVLPATAVVYPDPALLWRSASILFAAGGFTVPRDLRTFVERAYAAEPEADLATPAALEAAARRNEGIESGDRTLGGQVALKYDDGYRRSTTWVDDAAISTRLGEPRVTLRLARVENGAVVPYFADRNPGVAWAQSEVDVALRRVSGVAATRWDPAVDKVRATWGRFDRETPVLVLEPIAEGVWEGAGLDRGGKPVALGYSLATGLSVGR